MILATGFLKPERFQVEEARVKADDSFCAAASAAFINNLPSFDGWENAYDTATLLKLRNVEPHSDAWVGRGPEPRVRRAIFWLLEGGGQSAFGLPLIFGCGRKHIKMKPGDFVVFNDSIDHWVMSEKLWRGAAIQLRKVKL
jgi:hypothetical protein